MQKQDKPSDFYKKASVVSVREMLPMMEKAYNELVTDKIEWEGMESFANGLRTLADLITNAIPEGIKREECLLSPFHLEATENELFMLFVRLADSGYIPYGNDSLRSFFFILANRGSIEAIKPLIWLRSCRSLSWFLSMFVERTDGANLWKKAKLNFRMKNGKAPKPSTLRSLCAQVTKSEGATDNAIKKELNGLYSDFAEWKVNPNVLNDNLLNIYDISCQKNKLVDDSRMIKQMLNQ